MTGESNPSEYKSDWSAGAKMQGDNRTIWFNSEPYHVAAAALARYQEALLKKATKNQNATVYVANRVPPNNKPQNFMAVIMRKYRYTCMYIYIRIISVFQIQDGAYKFFFNNVLMYRHIHLFQRISSAQSLCQLWHRIWSPPQSCFQFRRECPKRNW